MANSAANDVLIYNGRGASLALAKREIFLLSAWERERRLLITIDEIRGQVGPDVARDVVRRLVRKGALHRLRRGRYLLRPFRTLLRPTLPSTAVAAAALLHDEPYYLGGPWAASYHRLTEQRYASLVDAFVGHRLVARTLGAGRVRFHAVASDLLAYGTTATELEGLAVRVSDVERTLLDALDHPRVFWGLDRAVQMAGAHLNRLDRRRLVAHAVRGSKPGTCQRLGVLLERAGASPRSLAPLRARALQTASLLSLTPGAPRAGPVNRRWNVVENDR